MKQSIARFLRRFPLAHRAAKRLYRLLVPEFRSVQRAMLDGLGGRRDVFFVQVGANDGMHGDPLRDLILRHPTWRGIFVEPVGYLIERLKANYDHSDRFIFEMKAIAADRQRLNFYYVSSRAKDDLGDDLPDWYDQLGSFDRQHIVKHLGGKLEPYIVAQPVEAVTLMDILRANEVPGVDLLYIDVEGADYKVLATLDFERYKPRVIVFEHKHLSPDELRSADALLAAHGYRYKRLGNDTLAIRPNGAA